jgi:hypothetical protein
VVVAAGFALWQGGKCVAAARWSDIRRVRAYRKQSSTDDSIRLGVELKDGSLMEFHEDAPGFDLFLQRASATLSGMLPFAAWHPPLVLAPGDSSGTVIYERTGY